MFYVLLAFASLYAGALSYWAYGNVLPQLGKLSLLGFTIFDHPNLPLSLTRGEIIPFFSEAGFEIFRVIPFTFILALALFGNRHVAACCILLALGFVGYAYGLILASADAGYYAWFGRELYYGLQATVVIGGAVGIARAHEQAIILHAHAPHAPSLKARIASRFIRLKARYGQRTLLLSPAAATNWPEHRPLRDRPLRAGAF